MAFKQNNKQIKKIIKELKGASKLHAGQAEKLEKMVDDSPFHKDKPKSGLGRKDLKTTGRELVRDYDLAKQAFGDSFSPSDTIIADYSKDLGISIKKAGLSAKRAAGSLADAGPSYSLQNFPRPKQKIYQTAKDGSYVTFQKFDKDELKGSVVKPTSALKKRMGKFKDSKAPDAEGKFRDLAAPALASWMIKSRKGNLSKIISSLNQQIIFRRNKDPKYAAKMRRTQDIVRKRLGKDKK